MKLHQTMSNSNCVKLVWRSLMQFDANQKGDPIMWVPHLPVQKPDQKKFSLSDRRSKKFLAAATTAGTTVELLPVDSWRWALKKWRRCNRDFLKHSKNYHYPFFSGFAIVLSSLVLSIFVGMPPPTWLVVVFCLFTCCSHITMLFMP